MSKRKPTGFIAICQCGNTIGAADVKRSRTEDLEKLLSDWLISGCTIKPKFKHTWSAKIKSCECEISDLGGSNE